MSAVAALGVWAPCRLLAVDSGTERRAMLSLDPVLSFSTLLGGSRSDTANAVAIDNDGNTYVVGTTESVDFGEPVTGTPRGLGFDAFVTKFDSAGQVVYSLSVGGSGGLDVARAVAVDAVGRAYVVGSTNSPDFPRTAGWASRAVAGSADAFLSVIAPDGSRLEESLLLGGSATDSGQAIAVDASGRIVIIGFTNSEDFPLSGNVFGRGGMYDGFIAVLTPAAQSILSSRYFGGSDNDFAFGVALASSGEIIVSGTTGSHDLPIVKAVQPRYGGGRTDAFVAAFDNGGQTILSSTYFGGSGDDQGTSVAVDGLDRRYVAGWTSSADLPLFRPVQAQLAGGNDGFIARLDPTPGIDYATYVGGKADDRITAIASSASGEAIVAGATGSSDLPIVSPIQSRHGGGLSDGFVAALRADGAAVELSSYIGGDGSDTALGISVNSMGTIALAGASDSTDFPVVRPVSPLPKLGDAFVANIVMGEGGQNCLYVANEAAGTFSVIEPTSRQMTGAFQVAPSGWSISDAAAAARTMYVAIRPDRSTGQNRDASAGAIVRIDAARNQVIGIMPIEATPTAIAFDTARDRLYVGTSDQHVLAMDPETGVIDGVIALPTESIVDLLVAENYLYAVDLAGDQIVAVSIDEPGTVHPIMLPQGSAPTSVVAIPGRSTLFAAARLTSRVLEIDTSAMSVTGEFPTEPYPELLLVSPDGETVYVSHGAQGEFGVITVLRPSPIPRAWVISTPATVKSLALIDGGRFLFASLGEAESVIDIDTQSSRVFDSVGIGGYAGQTASAIGATNCLAAPTCPGDCSHDGRVTIDELVLGVRIVLGADDLLRCSSYWTTEPTVADVIAGVAAALSGCAP